MTRTLPAVRQQRQAIEPAPSGTRSLAVMVLVAGSLGVALWLISGPPSALWRLPDLAAVRASLTATEIADRELIAVATTVAWLVLGYLAVTVTLRCAALAADRATRGARWARAALRLTNLITVPAVRRVVDGGVAGTLLLASWMPVSRVAAVAEPAAVISLPVAVAGVRDDAPRSEMQQAERPQVVTYTVVRGDDLWGIARRMYGDGSRYVDLFEANRGRVMADGAQFTDPRVISVGWVLHIPLPSPRIDVEAGTPTYRVIPGDHLWGIAERFLGDGFRWPELWEANRDREMGDGWRFTNPNLIYPGWQIELPVEVLAAAAATDERVTPAVPEPAVTPWATPADPPAPEVDPTPASEEVADTDGGSGISWDWPSPPRPLLITAAGFAVLGTAALFVSRVHRTGLLHAPSFLRRSARRTGDAGRVALVARAVVNAIAEAGHRDARLLLVHETERDLICTLACPSGDADVLAEAGVDLSERLDCTVEGVATGAQRVELVLTNAGETAMRHGSAAAAGQALMLPVGTDMVGRIAYLNLAGVGSVFVSGLDAELRPVLHGWLATLGTTAGADELALRADAAAAGLMGDDAWLPHFGGTESPDTETLVEELEDVIQSREEASTHRSLVAVLDAGAEAARLDAIVPYASEAGVYLVGVASPGDAGDRNRELFGATVHLGVEGVVDPGDESEIDRGSMLLSIGSGEPLRLDSVLVRRDTSPRWHEGGLSRMRVTSSALPDIPEAPSLDNGGPSNAEDGSGPFDWRRAVFEPISEENGASEATTSAAAALVDDLPKEQPVVALADRLPASRVAVEPGAASEATETAEPAAHDGDDQLRGEDGLPERARVPADDEPAEVKDQANPVADLAEVSTHKRANASARAQASEPAGDVRSDRGDASPHPPEARSPTVRQQPLLLTEARSDAAPDEEGTESLIRVRCFGDFEVFVAGAPVTAWRYEKGRELVALLVAHGGAPVPRKVVTESLWPDLLWDTNVKHLMSNASTAARRAIRAAAGRDDLQPLTLARDRYQLQPGMFQSDLDEFETALRRAVGLPAADALEQYTRAVALYGGDVMQTETFEWLDPYREEYRKQFLEATRAAAEIALELGEPERAARFYSAGMERAPTDEILARGLMRCQSVLGDPSGVRKVFQVLTAALQRELDAPSAAPSAETRALLEELTSAAVHG